MSSTKNKRIFINTILLYIRMLMVMGVSLYTSRVVLNSLGVVDFGIYNVVGGVVGMFSFLNGSMASATQRFLTFGIGKGEEKNLKKIFNTSVLIHVLLAFVILIIGETIGLWYLNTKMVIPVDRMYAAQWVYQLSLFSSILTIISVPYNAVIIAHEKMKAFAYISVIEVILKLGIVLYLSNSHFDRLILYAVLLFCVSFLVRIVYGIYCKRNFEETKFKLIWSKKLFNEMLSFASWSLLGNLAGVGITQGLNLLLNAFFGPAINAARGVTVQVQTAVNSFAFNFQTALNPQITKSYAGGDFKYMHSLIFTSSKYSYFLLLLLSLPVMIETEQILTWWLKIVPEHTISFLRIILLTSLIDALANPLMISAQATGNIKKYQVILSSILLLIVPVSYFFLKNGAIPEVVFGVHLCVAFLCQLVRLWLIKGMIGLSLRNYAYEVFFKIILVTILSVMLPLALYYNLPLNWKSFLLVCSTCFASVVIFIYLVGLKSSERLFIKNKIMILLNPKL